MTSKIQAIYDEHEELDDFALQSAIVTCSDGSLSYVGGNYEATVRKQKARRDELQAMCAEEGHLYRWMVNGIKRQSFCACCGHDRNAAKEVLSSNLLKTA